MGRSRFYVINESPHFLTCTVVNWIPMFSDPNIAKLLLDSLMFLQYQQRLKLFAYVIMENHLHLLGSSAELSKEIGNFKSFTARQIVDYLEEKKHYPLLKQLSFYKSEHKKIMVLPKIFGTVFSFYFFFFNLLLFLLLDRSSPDATAVC